MDDAQSTDPSTSSVVVVLSIGNSLRTDDGMGGHAMRALQARLGELESEVRLVDGSVMGLELIAHVDDATALIVLDAVDAGREPGELIRLEGDDVPAVIDPKMSMHQAGLADLLATLKLIGRAPSELVLLGLQPAVIDWGTELSPVIQAALPRLVNAAEREVRRVLGR
jgi:hydrogenase maturation protease